MKFVVSFLLILFFNNLKAQNDTTKIYNAKHFKKGIYKNAKEFLVNNPSINKEFTFSINTLKDSTEEVVIASLGLIDSSNAPRNVWGFCDGTNIYVHYPMEHRINKYFKLQVIDFFSCFTCTHNDDFRLGVLGNLLNDAINGNPVYDLMQITSRGEIWLLDITRMKMLLSRNQKLLKEFKQKLSELRDLKSDNESIKTNKNFLERELMIDYLAKLNKVI